MKTQLNTHIRLMAISIFFVLLTGLSSLFSMNLMHQELDSLNQSHQKLLTATLAIEEAHTQFKIQVQEWKNLLLRGNNPDDYKKYFSSFNYQTDQVQQSLNTAKTSLNDNLLNEIDEAIKQHKELVEIYLKTLSGAKLDNLNDIESVDESIRGIDRPLDTLFPQLSKKITNELQEKVIADNELQEKYYNQNTLLISSFVSASIIFIILSFWISNRK